MPSFCQRDIREAAIDLLGTADADGLLESLKDVAKQKAAKNLTKISDELDNAAEELIADKNRLLQIAKRNAHINIIRSREVDEYLKEFPDKSKGLMALLTGIQSNIKNSRFSTQGLQKSSTADLFNVFTKKLSEGELTPLFYDKKLEAEYVNSMWEGGTGTSDIDKLAKATIDTLEISRKMLNKNGAVIGDLEQYIAHQAHNPAEIMKTSDSFIDSVKDRVAAMTKTGFKFDEASKILKDKSFERWNNSILPELSEETIERIKELDPDINKTMREFYEGFVTGEHLKPRYDTEPTDTLTNFRKKGSPLSAKVSRSRFFKFKDGDAWRRYNAKFGYGTVQQAIISTLESSGKNLGILKIWGTNPEALFEKTLRDVQFDSRGESGVKSRIQKIKNVWGDVTGQTNIPVDFMLAKIGSSIRAMTTFSKLGTVLPSSFADIAIRAGAMKDTLGKNMLSEYAESFKSLIDKTEVKEQKQILDSLGVWSEHEFGNIMSYFTSGDSPAGFTSKAMQQYFKLNGMNWWDFTHRSAAGMTIARDLAFNRELPLNKLHENLQSTFKLYGIESNEWDLIRKNALAPRGKRLYITPDGIADASDADIKIALGNEKASKYEIDNYRTSIGDRLRHFFIDSADKVILFPDAGDRQVWLHGSKPGTWNGELFRFIGQFKYFPTAFTRKTLGRMVYGKGATGIIDAIRTGRFDKAGMANIMIGGTALGYLSIMAKDAIKGLTPPDPRNPETILRSFVQSGTAGIFSDLLFNAGFNYGTLASIAGPSLAPLSKIPDFIGQLETGKNPGSAAVSLIKSEIPNVWFLQTAMNYLFLWGIQEHVSPGYVNRMVRRVKKKRDQEFFISPHNAIGVR